MNAHWTGVTKMYQRGLVLMKAMPGHVGHRHLINFACGMCDRVDVAIDCVAGEWPSATTRAEDMRSDLADLPVVVHALKDCTPQQPDEHPDFWGFWRDTLIETIGFKPDVLVASMAYGLPLAGSLECEFLPLEFERQGIPLSATMIRSNPTEHWDSILPHSRRHYLTRIAIEGPESTGKSTLGLELARSNGWTYAPEWAKCYIEQMARAGREFSEEDLAVIARGQIAMERSLELQSRPVMISDTSVLTTIVWSRFLYERVSPDIERLFDIEEARSPRTRLLFTPETPWFSDVHRKVAADAASDKTRQRFFEIFLQEIEKRSLSHEIVEGNFPEKRSRLITLASKLSQC